MRFSPSTIPNLLPLPHSIALFGLSLALLLNFLYRPSISYALYLIAMAAIALLGHALWKRSIKLDVFLKDTIVSLLIVLLLLEPATTVREAIPAVLVILVSLILRKLVRFKGLPMFNPAASAIMVAILLSYTAFVASPLVSWWGTNYALGLGGFRLPVGTAISVLLMACVVTKLRKWMYAIAFFVPFLILGLVTSDPYVLRAILLDGTIYFFFAVMACEPKTAPVATKHQFIVGLILALALAAALKFSLPSEHVMALLIANVATFGLKHVPFLKSRLG